MQLNKNLYIQHVKVSCSSYKLDRYNSNQTFREDPFFSRMSTPSDCSSDHIGRNAMRKKNIGIRGTCPNSNRQIRKLTNNSYYFYRYIKTIFFIKIYNILKLCFHYGNTTLSASSMYVKMSPCILRHCSTNAAFFCS